MKPFFYVLLTAPPLFLFDGVSSHAADPARDAAALDRLVSAYPDVLVRHDDRNIYWRDGTVMNVGDDIPNKSFDQLLKKASLLDQLRLVYLPGRLPQPPHVNEDPGRFRNKSFFQKMYGDCRKGQVQQQMASITWLPHSWGRSLPVTTVNGIDQQLRIVSEEIEALPDSIKRAAYPSAGTFSCRPVKDTGQFSMHAYAAAIDLKLAVSDYWLWQTPRGKMEIPYKNRMPQEIVDIFEKHGFVWGGKWYHYDTMHFEYRPELTTRDPAAQ
jgi:hypothetical protein